MRFARDPVLFARVKLTRLAEPALTRPAVAQVNIDLNGRLVRAQAARLTMGEAIDEVHDRLCDRIQRATGDWEAIHGGRPSEETYEWRHSGAPTTPSPFYPRPVAERQVVRHKTFSLARTTVDEAAFDMEMLGYEFHLFTEHESGVDSMLYRTDDGAGCRLAQLDPRPDRVAFGITPVTLSARPAPRLTVTQAVDRLNVTGQPFVFFRHAETGRGCVLYHRYDGHYGLITPAD